MSQDLNTWQEVALVAAPVIAALAALASWASVWQARKLGREANAPHLMAQKMAYPDGTIGAVITNAGGGAARGAFVYLAHPPYYATSSLGHGFLFPGETRHLRTNIPLVEGIETDVLVFCRDKNSFGHWWNADEDHRCYKTRLLRRPRYRKDVHAVFREFHPAIDLGTLTQAQTAVTLDPP
jgi:hypothetical protein